MKLKDFATINMGQSPKGETYNTDGNGMPFLQGRKTFGRIYPTIDTWTTNPIKIANKDEILMSVRAPVGDMNFANQEICIGRGLCSISAKNGRNKYLYYMLLNSMNELKQKSTGTVFDSINRNDLENLEINFHSEKEQEKIENILGNIDEKIELNNEINNNLHDLAEQQFNEIYSKGTRGRLDELLFNVSTGSRPKGGAQEIGVPSVGAEKIEKFGIYDYSSEKYISEEYYEKLKNGKLNSGDVLLYKDGAYTGKVSMSLNGFPHNKAAVNEHVFILNTENNWAQNYLYFTLYNKDNKEMLHRLASSKAAQPGLNQTELKSIEINICNKEHIICFENKVKPIMEKIALNSLENKMLSELRDTLLPKLMNGEIDLDNIEI